MTSLASRAARLVQTMGLVEDPLLLDFGRDKHFCVYLYRDPRKGKRKEPIYVGKGVTRKRPEQHWRGQAHKNPIFLNVMNKIRAANLVPIIEFCGFFDDELAALVLEKNLIARFGRRDKRTGPLCNLTDGGEANVGRVVTSITRERMRAAHLGKKKSAQASAAHAAAMRRPETREKLREARLRQAPLSDEARQRFRMAAQNPSLETRRKISEALRRRGPRPAETRSKISAALTGLKRSEETLAKMRASRLGKSTITDEGRKSISAHGRARQGERRTPEAKENMRKAWVLRKQQKKEKQACR